jgi:PHD/YefM family antitoxin component YafN of YafNO toxin-antitoxin module
MVRSNGLAADAVQVLEEKLELSNVTDLRKNLLPAIEGIAKNPALRYLILKRGRPQAVLMSAQTYDLVKKIMNQVASTQAAVPREEAIESAYERLRAERGRTRPVAMPATSSVVGEESAATATASSDAQKAMNQVMTMLQEIRSDMKQLRRTEASKAEVASVNHSML